MYGTVDYVFLAGQGPTSRLHETRGLAVRLPHWAEGQEWRVVGATVVEDLLGPLRAPLRRRSATSCGALGRAQLGLLNGCRGEALRRQSNNLAVRPRVEIVRKRWPSSASSPV